MRLGWSATPPGQNPAYGPPLSPTGSHSCQLAAGAPERGLVRGGPIVGGTKRQPDQP